MTPTIAARRADATFVAGKADGQNQIGRKMSDNPFHDTFDETGRSFFRGVGNAVALTGSVVAVALFVFALVAWCAP